MLKGFFDSDVEVENTCDHEEGVSTTRVVLILLATALTVGAIGYTLRPIADIIKEIWDDPDIPNIPNIADKYITVKENKIKLDQNNTDNKEQY